MDAHVLQTSASKLAGEMADEGALSPTRRPVLVGVDGFGATPSAEAIAAVRWAAGEARSRGTALHVVSVVDFVSLPTWSRRYDSTIVSMLADDARLQVAAALALVAADDPDSRVPVTGEVLRGDTEKTLDRLSSEAGEIVVGSRQLPWLGRTMLGSVSSLITATAQCPVIVVGEDVVPSASGAVVVGVAGDDATQPALRFAFDYAARRDLAVRAIYAPSARVADPVIVQRDATRWLVEALAGVVSDYPDIQVEARVEIGHAADELLRAADQEHMIVLGRPAVRKHPSLHIGSVGMAVLHHATCPVAVVPA